MYKDMFISFALSSSTNNKNPSAFSLTLFEAGIDKVGEQISPAFPFFTFSCRTRLLIIFRIAHVISRIIIIAKSL